MSFTIDTMLGSLGAFYRTGPGRSAWRSVVFSHNTGSCANTSFLTALRNDHPYSLGGADLGGRLQTNSPGLSRAITRAEMPRGVAVASIARLPSSTDDPRASGSTADRHEPVEDWGSTRGHVHGFQSMLIAKGGKGTLDPHACNPRAIQHITAPRETPLQGQPPSPTIVEHDLEHCPSPSATTPS